jgi:hypothetical protein
MTAKSEGVVAGVVEAAEVGIRLRKRLLSKLPNRVEYRSSENF